MRALLVLGFLLGVLATSCTKEAESARVDFQVNFPSTSLAIATEKVKFIVYDDPDPAACQRIYLKRITNQADLPPVVLSTPEIALCDLALRRSPSLEVPLGKHSILAVGLRNDADLLLGCSDVALSSDGGSVIVDLALPSTTPLPPLSSCTSVIDFCNVGAACQ